MENGVKGASLNSKPKKKNKPNIISTWFICWVCPVLIKGNKRNVEESDLIPPPSKKYNSRRAGDTLERCWLIEYERALQENRDPSLWRAILKAYWLSYMPGAIYVLIASTARTIQPMMFAELLQYWAVDSNMTEIEAGMYALIMLGLNFVAMMAQHHSSLFTQRFSMKVKVACSSLLYRKDKRDEIAAAGERVIALYGGNPNTHNLAELRYQQFARAARLPPTRDSALFHSLRTYHQLLRVNQTAVGDIAAGKLVNLLSNDVARFDYGFMFLHNLWITPIQAGVVLWLVWEAAGFAPFVGFFGVLAIIFPIQAFLTKLTAVIRRETAQRTDRRIKLMGEIIDGIQVIKMYAWEKPFQKVVEAARAFEIISLTKSIFVRSVFLGFMMFTERAMIFVTCLTLILSGTMVTATTIYPIQQYFSIVQMNVTLILPMAIASLSEMFVAFDRIRSFLVLEEREDLMVSPKSNFQSNLVFTNKRKSEASLNSGKQKFSQTDDSNKVTTEARGQPGVTGDFAIELSGVSASWTNSKESSELTLKDLSMRMRKGRMCAIIGPVGSGKSSLLQVLLKELTPCKGTFNVQGRISYASQDSWLFPASVRENILFGLPYEVKKYKEVCQVCCLMPDFKQFPYGDQSLVGERGVSLSGGQRARINLARAIYREADVYLLDDPLSAVDANVGRLLFEGCINGYLRGRTCILVTHQVHFLKAAEQIVILNEGAIENMGTYDELAKSGKDFSLLLRSLQEGDKDDDEKLAKRTSMKRSLSLQRGVSVKSEDGGEEQQEQVIADEKRASGALKWETIVQYLSAVRSWPLVVVVFLALFIAQAAATITDYWLSYWTNNVNDYMEANNGAVPDTSLETVVGTLSNAAYIGIYGGLVGSVIILLLFRITVFVIMTTKASQNLHNTVFKNLIGAIMRFFDTNPSGRVLNRFSKDLGAMDELLPRSFLETIQMYLLMISVLVLNATALPWTLIPTAVLIIIFGIILKWYLNAAQSVKRLEGTTKSPVFGKINSTIQGLSTIRSSNAQDRLLQSFDEAQDLHSSAFYTFIGGSSAFGMYLDTLCLFYLAVILAIFIFIDFGELLPVGSVGLAVSQSMVMTIALQMAARFTADFLAQTTSVERVLEYTKLPTEKNIDFGPTQPPKEWPSKGNVKFEKLFLKYGPEDAPVLKNLNIDIQNGWKLGVVGRTGAGKSSLISALFQLYDIDGTIKIDSIDTLGIAKQELRSKISIIPQEPVLFSATVRYNLDPFDNHSDDNIWRALEQVELIDAVPALDFKISEGGSNFSVGQRQLFCLARAVLRSNKILVMDEATANVDPQTDSLIQKTIRRQFASCTVITIAHRLNTIMDSDRVLVMDKGEAAEFDHPYNLLNNPQSIFSFMVKETGSNMNQALYEIAKNKYLSNNQEQPQ